MTTPQPIPSVEEVVAEFQKEFPLLYSKQIMTSEPQAAEKRVVDWLRATLTARDKAHQEAMGELFALHYKLVDEFADNLITIALENDAIRGCV